jgi:arginine repressor
MKTLQVVRVNSNDGDTHYVFLDTQSSKKNLHAQDYDEIEIKKVSKQEASKPLILIRAE